MNITDFAPWICWISPLIGALLTLLSRDNTVKGVAASSSVLVSWISALLMVPMVSTNQALNVKSGWIYLPEGEPTSLGMLVDSLSIIMVNIVSFVSFLILVYSTWYMRREDGQTRFWALMSLFTSSMLLLVLADNFILFFIGWKMVGLCSFALIGHYYRDEERYWIGGPPPSPFQKPSTCALKALLVTSFGDVAMLSGIILIFVYSKTFNFVTLLNSSPEWMLKMAQSPGLILASIILLLLGVAGKSAQFPLHIWLPEAMAGPAPVSALIHAATMVKAGVYIVARLFPLYYNTYWIVGIQEARFFFQIVAFLGVATAFLTATEAVTALEIKKILAYSTMSQIGYMMMGLGAAGLSQEATIAGYSGSMLHLLSHALFKAALFMSAGAVIHLTGSIYIHEKSLDKRRTRLIWFFTWVSVLSLIGVPPFSGFWSKDEVLAACLESGQILLFSLGLLTAFVTCLYSIRMMYHVFRVDAKVHDGGGHTHSEEEPVMVAPIGVLSGLSLIIGILGYWFKNLFKEIFHGFLSMSLRLETYPRGEWVESTLIPLSSISVIAIASVASYFYYVKYRADYVNLIVRNPILEKLHKVFWNRWYIDKFYESVFVRSILSVRSGIQGKLETSMDVLLNIGVPGIFSRMSQILRSMQTGLLYVNMLYVLIFLAVMMIFLLVG
ncbi:MAG: NADH-quinone oxidoreductase subunit L [Nitrososphaerota archaeon]